MADTVKKISIAGVAGDSRDIGAEAQYIEVSYDAAGNIITDITAPGAVVDHTESVAEALADTPPKSHASTTNEYGAASKTEFGHIKVGVGLDISGTTGATNVSYGTTANTACQGNDGRLGNARKNPYAVSFNNGVSDMDYDGSVAKTVNHETVGAAPKKHDDITTQYGLATKDRWGHIRIGEGLENDSSNKLTLSIASSDNLGGVKPDGETITIDEDGTLHGGGSGGSTVEIYTSEPSLYNKTITIAASAGSEPVEATFDADGYAILKGYMGTGSVIFTSSGGGQTASGSMNIPYFGNYSITLAFWSAPVTITTPTAEMYGLPINIRKDDLIVGSTSFDGSGTANYTAHAPGTYTFECTLGWKTFSTSIVISAEQGYSAYIQGFVAHITVMTTTIPEFQGATVAVMGTGSSGDSIPTTTLVLGSDNTAVYTAYEAGVYTFSIAYEGETYPKNQTVTGQTDYTVAINLWTAVVNIHTNDFMGMVAQVHDENDVSMGSITFDSAGDATYRAHKAGTYIFSISE